MIKARNVSLVYRDGTVALQNINLNLHQGGLFYVIGPSGSGKTSLMKLLMGMEFPATGFLEVMGQPIHKRETAKIRKLRRDIGPVFQEFKLILGRTAIENVIMGMRFLDIPLQKARESAKNALVRVGLEHKAFTLVDKLSYGEAQRVAIARAVARKPALILADEPTGNLDHDNAVKILKLLESFKDKSTTVMITTHATHLIDECRSATLIHVKKGEISIERGGEQI
ncbi:MAG: ATP-binding cassette domain-containing protein [Bacillota bacterium]|jgi:cell division transport system ATP-binding protein|nr:ATP-binding cassette domain-containing protein [Bacillota bacterium]NLV63555.1 ATP-binding cassette domain-containing protein [Clostridiaceae bacterium]